jgi:hypothetical protein
MRRSTNAVPLELVKRALIREREWMSSTNKQNAITNSSKRFELPICVHQDDIVHGRIDFAAVRRREEAELKRLIAASQMPCRPAPKCDHERPVKSHVFADGKVLKLYGCGCSNGAEILNGRKNQGDR